MDIRHCFDPPRSWKTAVVLAALAVMAAGCFPAATAPGANVASGRLGEFGYTLLRWQQGLDILVWHDLAGSSCEGSAFAGDPVYRLRCQAESADGRRAGWEVQSRNGQAAQFSINGKAYDLAKGRLFLIGTSAGNTGVVQLQRDLSTAQVEDRRSIEMFALLDPDVSAFAGRTDPPAPPGRTGPVEATPTPIPPGNTAPMEATPTPVPPASAELPYDCLATVSATRPLVPHGTGDDCWLTLPDGDPAEIAFHDEAQITYRSLPGGTDEHFFAARKGDRQIKITGATIRPARFIARQFGGSIEAVKQYEIAFHSPGYPNGSPACLRDANGDYRALTSLCEVEVILDDAHPRTTYSGAWFVGDGGASYQGGCHWAPPGANFATFKPDLPVAGSYEIYAWGCGDPNHDQAYRTDVSIYPFPAGVYAPPRVGVDLKDDPGRWVSIGTYYMEPGGWVGVGPWDARDRDAGNLAVDAFRFVLRSPAHVDITPTPAPTRMTWSTHPPGPEEQLTSGDLDVRLGLVQWMYQYTPARGYESTTFDDCTAFPRAGCAGTRSGWRMTVRYLGREPFEVTYRVSDDLRYVSLDVPDALRGRQLRYLWGQNGLRTLNVYRYPDGPWYVNVADRVTGGGGGGPLSPDNAAILEALAGRYATIGTGRDRLVSPHGWELHLYGLGTRVALDEDDRGRLLALVEELGGTLLPQ